MFSLIFLICLIWVVGKLFVFGVRAAWGMSKLLLTVVFLPLLLLGMVICGLIKLAFPLLLIIGIVAMFSLKDY